MAQEQKDRPLTASALWNEGGRLHRSDRSHALSAAWFLGAAAVGALYHFGVIQYPGSSEGVDEFTAWIVNGIDGTLSVAADFGTPFCLVGFLYCSGAAAIRHLRANRCEAAALRLQETEAAAGGPAEFRLPSPDELRPVVEAVLSDMMQERQQRPNHPHPPGKFLLPPAES